MLRKFDRPVNKKHLRAMQLIAGFFFTVAILTLFQWIRSLWISN
jgi:hypothetical protein